MPIRLQPVRALGATGVMVPLVGYGTAPLGEKQVSREAALRCLNHAIDLGVTYLDTSPDYGSEPHLGQVMRSRRSEVFLATKVNRRSREGAKQELESSLQKLQTDHVDLIQAHAVNTWADLEQVLAPDGALAGLEQARQEGKVRFIGITGHARPEILAHALAHYPFDTVLVALGMADRLVTGPETFLLHDTAVMGWQEQDGGLGRKGDSDEQSNGFALGIGCGRGPDVFLRSGPGQTPPRAAARPGRAQVERSRQHSGDRRARYGQPDAGPSRRSYLGPLVGFGDGRNADGAGAFADGASRL